MFVAEYNNHRIQKFDSSGNFITKWGSWGTGDGQFRYPIGVAVDSSGDMFVADTANNRIQKFDSSGNFITKWGSWGTGDGQFKYPWGVPVDSSGDVFVADTDNHRIQKFDSSGTYITKWGSYGTGDGQFNQPIGVAVDSSGDVFVTDSRNHRIQKFGSELAPVVLNCTCGDICVNETGWWRNNSVFNVSGTPIQHAISNATAGDTICVEDGTYHENVDVTKRLTIRPENGSDSTTVQAQSASDHVFEVTVDYVNVSGFTVTGATGSGKAGIHLSSGVDHCTISNNSASNNYAGICLNNADDNNVSCNWVHNNNQRGFYLYNGSTGNTIGNNNIMSNGVSASGSWHYNFYNDQINDVTATNNYWGTDNTTIIAESIYDKSDEGSKGTVTYDPFKNGAAPCAPIPEAATIVLFSIGLVVLVGYVWIKKLNSDAD